MEMSVLYKCFTECGVVTTDSRQCPPGSLFIALKGETFNGNAFARQALEKGCRYAVVDEPEYAADGDARILLVPDCLKALQALAREHRRRMGTRIVGITGTNGKTTTKELMAAVLQQRYRILYTQGNLNNHIGVPLTLLRLTAEHELAVIEMGASHPGDIQELVEIAEPDYGLITNVGKAHLQGFGSLAGVIRTKGELYDYLRKHGQHTVFLDKDNAHLVAIANGVTCMNYGLTGGNDLYVSGRLQACAPFLSLTWAHNHETFTVQTRLIGSYNLKNVLAAVAVGCFFQVPPADICRALEAYEPRNNRSQLTVTSRNKLVVDAYNANPTSMQAALENFRLMEVPQKMVILGDMKELGADSRKEHEAVVAQLRTCGFDRVVLVGEEFARVAPDLEHYADVDSLKAAWAQTPPCGYYILIKGSNSTKLWQLPDVL